MTDTLRAALKRYGRHEKGCAWYDGAPDPETPQTCTCGLRDALAHPPEPSEGTGLRDEIVKSVLVDFGGSLKEARATVDRAIERWRSRQSLTAPAADGGLERAVKAITELRALWRKKGHPDTEQEENVALARVALRGKEGSA